MRDKKQIVKFFPIENTLTDVEVSSLTIMNYNFKTKPNDLLLYDMDYIILVFNNKDLAFFRYGNQGFQRTTNGVIFDDNDITQIIDTENRIMKIHGYIIGDPDDEDKFKRYFVSVEL